MGAGSDILVTGGSGLLGQTLQSYIPDAIYLTSLDYDLRDYGEVKRAIKKHKPTTILHLAAKAGGIVDNINRPCEYLEDNILINTNVLRCARELGVNDILSMSSTCVYPMRCKEYPMSEDMLMDGEPEPTNDGYAYSKRVMVKQSQKSNQQYGTNFKFITPCNLYGETDNFHNLNKAHFVTALMMKIYKDQQDNKGVTLFGDGSPLRQFLHVEDLSWVIKMLVFEVGIENIDDQGLNVCTDEIYSIDEMAHLGYEVLGLEFKGLKYDNTKPNGVYRKDVSNRKLKLLLPHIKFIELEEGMKRVYDKISK